RRGYRGTAAAPPRTGSRRLPGVRLGVAGGGPAAGLAPGDRVHHASSDVFDQVGSGGEELHRLLLALTQARLAVTEPAARLLHHVKVSRDLHQVTQTVDAAPEDDVHLRLAERRRHL